ncbi:MAG: transglycosylase domain-containing protein [Chitinophagales bacterium]
MTGLKRKIAAIWKWIKSHPLKTILYLFGTGCIAIIIFLLLFYIGAFGKLPSKEALRQFKNPVASTVYGSNQEVIIHYYIQNRSNVDSTELNNYIKDALISVEDIRFYQHKGIDFRSLGRVLFKSILLSDKGSGGGSTLTQQLAKNVYGRKNIPVIGMLVNKIREMMIASRMEKIYSKDEILLLYLNTVMLGENLYGIEKVSHRYFNKQPKDLNLEESALIIGLLKAPNGYNPKNYPEKALNRRNVVLGQMYKYGKIDEATYLSTIDKKLALNYQQPKNAATYAAFYKDYLRDEFQTWAKKNPKPNGSLYDLNIDGLKIYTSVQPSIQRSAEKAMKEHLAYLQTLFDTNWDVKPTQMPRDSFVMKLMLQDKYTKELMAQGKTQAEIRQQFKKEGDKRIWTWDGFETVSMSFQEYITYELTRLHAGIFALDNRTGKIMAYVGGNDFNYSQYDQVQTPRQVGSTFKPIVYLAGLESGLLPCDFYDNSLKTYPQYEGWSPRNSDAQYDGSYSMWGALANSINTISAEIMIKTGIPKVIQLSKKMGLESELPKVPSLVLGTAEISLNDMVRAYAYIANGGAKIDPFSILKIEDEHGKVLYESKHYSKALMEKPESIQTIQKMMRAVVTQGTGGRFQGYHIPYNVIGKTGTTQYNADGWFIGSSPEITIGTWVGTLDKRVHFRSGTLGAGANTAMPIVARMFADLSLWRTPILSDFQYSITDFNCVAHSTLPAEEAQFIPLEVDSLQHLPEDSLSFPEVEQQDSLP